MHHLLVETQEREVLVEMVEMVELLRLEERVVPEQTEE
jgi:hypothetical protein